MISEQNNNKFYNMSYDGVSDTFNIEYGRVDATSQKETYPIKLWDKKYKEKLKKGYVDVSDLVSVDVASKDFLQETNTKVNNLIKLLENYRKNLVRNTYSVQASSITKQQITKAQTVLNEVLDLVKLKDQDAVNKKLIELYTIIPRKMYKVQDNLLPNINLDKLIEKEQDNLDAVSSEVGDLQIENKEQVTYLNSHQLIIEESTTHPEIKYLLDQVSHSKVKVIYKAKKVSEDLQFNLWLDKQKNKTTKFLIHGTRCSSVLSILEQGLKIRPTGNFQFSGKAYGQGNYFSETMVKSLNYCGYDNDKFILVYEVHVGNPFTYDGWYRGNQFTLNREELHKRGFDSTYVKAGNGLLNSEIIVYTEQQQNLKYIIQLN